ncbi:UNVERIFIED_CONTAM: hypothetical protein GTU68_057962 [Idotea baltica]|nr:hypothetical protein [Idotea baltica]
MLLETDWFNISWYGFFYGLTIMLSYTITVKLAQKDGKPLGSIADLYIFTFIGGLIGARLLNVFYYDWAYFSENLWEIPKIWNGGLASHGGLLGIAVAVWFFNKRNPQFTLAWLIDRMAIFICLGGALVRLGNLMNSEIYGKITNVPWAFIFEKHSPFPRHPSQVYEAILTFGLFLFLLFLAKKEKPLPPYRMLGLFLIIGFSGRFILEFFKEAGHLPQLLNIPFVVLGIVFLVISYRRKK